MSFFNNGQVFGLFWWAENGNQTGVQVLLIFQHVENIFEFIFNVEYLLRMQFNSLPVQRFLEACTKFVTCS